MVKLLCDEVTTFDRWLALVGPEHLVRCNAAEDWSMLTPLGHVRKESVLPKEALAMPLEMSDQVITVFQPSPKLPVVPIGCSSKWTHYSSILRQDSSPKLCFGFL